MTSAAGPKPADLFGHALDRHLDAVLDTTRGVSLDTGRDALRRADTLLFDGFGSGVPIEHLVGARSRFVDALLIRAWHHFLGELDSSCALFAVGGYGRGVLLPHSDIDLLILHDRNDPGALAPAIEPFLTFLWDIGLTIGHSVRTPQECATQAADNVKTFTNLLEARQLHGNPRLALDMQAALAVSSLWPSADYFRAKREEQIQRHRHYGNTVYTLEPDIKESPGGLRDIQTVGWIAKRRWGADSVHRLLSHGLLMEREYDSLQTGRAFLWRVRFALHMLTQRCEDRLLFDHQVRVARLFGYSDKNNNLAVEQFMQQYYRNAGMLSMLNTMLMQLFDETIVHDSSDTPPQPVNARFVTRRGLLAARHDDIFRRSPQALLETFRLMQQQPQIRGLGAQTMRLLQRDRHRINDTFRKDIKNRRLFAAIVTDRQHAPAALRTMNRLGLLGRYLPVFGRIVGHMQYDLFHTLTVDEHILTVMQKLCELLEDDRDDDPPLARHIMQHLDSPELLYIAALFHDIAKGRQGDHSQLGAEHARDFCHTHGLSSTDTDLVCWLVREHLLMSMTAQRRDINDPSVVYEFAKVAASQQRLDMLYVLTVCDIRGTNPKLWNSWKDSLLTTLYHNATRTLAGSISRIDTQQLIDETRLAAAAMLTHSGVPVNHFTALWERFNDDFFLRNTTVEIAWQTQAILDHGQSGNDGQLVLIDDIGNQGTTVFVYTRDRDYLFGLCTGVLAQLGTSILNARIHTTGDGYTLDSYVIADSEGDPITDPRRCREIASALTRGIASPQITAIDVTRRRSRRKRYFTVPTKVTFRADDPHLHTIMELVTADFPGLLSTVGEIFRKRDILVHTARISTIGERAEDIFYITDPNGQPLRDPQLFQRLRGVMTRVLDRMQE